MINTITEIGERSGQRLPGLDDILGVLLAARTREDFADHAFLIDNESGTVKPFIMSTVQLLGAPHAVFIYDDMFGICDQREWQVEFFRKFFMTRHFVRTNAQHHETLLLQQCVVIAEIAGLYRTGWRVIFGIEIQNDLLPFIIGQAHLVAVLVPARECRGLIAFLKLKHL